MSSNVNFCTPSSCLLTLTSATCCCVMTCTRMVCSTDDHASLPPSALHSLKRTPALRIRSVVSSQNRSNSASCIRRPLNSPATLKSTCDYRFEIRGISSASKFHISTCMTIQRFRTPTVTYLESIVKHPYVKSNHCVFRNPVARQSQRCGDSERGDFDYTRQSSSTTNKAFNEQ